MGTAYLAQMAKLALQEPCHVLLVVRTQYRTMTTPNVSPALRALVQQQETLPVPAQPVPSTMGQHAKLAQLVILALLEPQVVLSAIQILSRTLASLNVTPVPQVLLLHQEILLAHVQRVPPTMGRHAKLVQLAKLALPEPRRVLLATQTQSPVMTRRSVSPVLRAPLQHRETLPARAQPVPLAMGQRALQLDARMVKSTSIDSV